MIKIKEARNRLGIGGKTAAMQCGMTLQCLYKIEACRFSCSARNVLRIADGLGICIEELFGQSGNTDPKTVTYHGMGDVIRKKRTDLFLTQSELAQKLGVQSRTVQYWEQCVNVPSADTLKKLSEALDCTVGELFAKRTN